MTVLPAVGDPVVAHRRKPGQWLPVTEGTRGVVVEVCAPSIYPLTVQFDGGLVTPVRAGDVAPVEAVAAHSP